MGLRLLSALAAATLSTTPALAQAPRAGGNSANESRASTHTDSPGVLIPPGVALSSPESCSVESTLATGQLRFGFLINLSHEPKGCERRRDAWLMLISGDAEASKERMCDEPKVRAAYARAGHPCAS